MSHAFPKERIIREVFFGLGQQGLGPGQIEGIGFERDLSFTVKYYDNSPEWDSTLMIFKNELRTIGVELKPMPYAWKELMRIYEDKDFEAVVGGWQMDWDLDYFQLWHSSQVDLQGSSNHCGFSDPRVDELAVKLRETFTTPERIAIVQEIQAIIHEQQPYTFFRSSEGIFVWQNRGPPAPDTYLDGVTEGFDRLHPLVNRSRLFWRFRN
jgi:ABC-type transport system substrate-binding protein